MANIQNTAKDLLKALNSATSDFCIGLIGAAGAGKSSLINTLLEAVKPIGTSVSAQEYIEYVPTAITDMEDGHTRKRALIKLTGSISVIDNRGWHNWEHQVALDELAAQIGG